MQTSLPIEIIFYKTFDIVFISFFDNQISFKSKEDRLDSFLDILLCVLIFVFSK